MTNHDYPGDSLQHRYLTPAGSPPERFPDDDDKTGEANDEPIKLKLYDTDRHTGYRTAGGEIRAGARGNKEQDAQASGQVQASGVKDSTLPRPWKILEQGVR